MTECKIRGPYLPVGDTEWECVRHEVNARLKEDAQARINAGLLDPNGARKSDFYCPVGRVVESLAELGAVSEEKVEEIITSVLEEERAEAMLQFDYGTHLNKLNEMLELNFEPQRRPIFEGAMDTMRFWEAGRDRPITYGGDTNQRVQGVRAQYSFIDEAAEIAPVDPTDLIGAQVSLKVQTDANGFISSANTARIATDALAATMRRITPSKRQK